MKIAATLKSKECVLWIIASLICLIFSLVFVLNYPINVAGYDGPNYLRMLINKESNLIHASGFPLIMSWILGLFTSWTPDIYFDPVFLGSILVAQHSFYLTVLFLSAIIIHRYFGLFPAIGMMLLWGTSTAYLSGVSAVLPEWMQGAIIALSTVLCLAAFVEKRASFKYCLYMLSFGLYVVSYLVKFNSLPILALFAVLLVFDSQTLRFRAKVLGSWLIIGVAIIQAFIHFFHYPTTGTRDLTYDHAWILVAATEREILETDGINALRWRALSSVLPPDYGKAGAYRNVNDIAQAAERAPYLKKFKTIMAMDIPELKNFNAKNDLPAAYKHDVSSIPLYYYIGLKATDELGIKLFIESILNAPVTFLGSVIKRVFTVTPTSNTRTVVPTSYDILGLQRDAKFPNECCRFVEIAPWYTNLYWNPKIAIGEFGMRFVSVFTALKPWGFLEVIFWLIAIILFLKSMKSKGGQILIAMAITWLGFVSASHVVGVMRFKEAFAIWPFTALFWAMILCSVWKTFKPTK